MTLTRRKTARKIGLRLDTELHSATRRWAASNPINHYVLGDLLPPGWAREIRDAFPRKNRMTLERSVRELRYVSAPCCLFNCYFSREPAGGGKYFHATSFRRQPEQPPRDLALRTDISLRMLLRRAFPLGVRENHEEGAAPRS